MSKRRALCFTVGVCFICGSLLRATPAEARQIFGVIRRALEEAEASALVEVT